MITPNLPEPMSRPSRPPHGTMPVALPPSRGRTRWRVRLAGAVCAVAGFGLVPMSAGPVAGQVHNLRQYTNRDGLPQLQVLAVHQDETGYVWFGTYGGLSRFDGAAIRTLTAEDGLSSNVVTEIAPGRHGRLWVGTLGGGVCAMEAEGFACLDRTDGLASDNVEDMIADDDGTVWVATQQGLSRLREDGITTFTRRDGLPSSDVSAVVRDAGGRLWVGTARGLARLEGGTFRAVHDSALDGRSVQALLQLPEGLLIGTDAGLHLLAGTAVTPMAIPEAAAGAPINDVALARSGAAWIATDRGLLRYEGGLFQLLTVANGLPVNRVSCVSVDREDNVWFGTDRGATKLVPGPFQVYGVPDGLPNEFIRALAEDAHGRLWAGTRDGVGIEEAGGFRPILEGDDLPDGRVYALNRAPGGGMLVGTRGGLLHWRAEGRLRRYARDDGLPSDHVLALLEDGEGGVWVGTRQGLARWRDGEIIPFPAGHPLADAFVVSLRSDPQGRLWIGLYSGGVRVWDGNEVTVLDAADGLTEQTVWAMDVDPAGRMWVGSNGDGVFIVDRERIRRLTSHEGLVNDFVWQVLSDSDGSTWLYTNRGLQRFRGGRLDRSGVGDGLVPLEGSAGASLEDSRGRLWFGTSSGLLEFQPDLERSNQVPPPIVIDGVTVGGEPLEPGQEVRPGSPAIRASFAALSYREEASVRYRYRLRRRSGDPPAWSEPLAERVITFAGLGPGSYVFEVLGVNDGGVPSTSPAAFSFVVLPAFWQTRWFWALAFVLLSAGVSSIPALRARRLAADRARLEARVAEHTGELRQANDRLREEIGERERFEEALRVSETRLREIVENSTNVFYSHAPDHALTYLSPQIRGLLGVDPEDALVRWTEFLTDHPDNSLGYEATARAIETGERQPPYELQLRHADGHDVWVRVTEAPVVRDGRTVGIIGSLTDITETRAAEAESRRLEEQLHQSQKMEAVGRLAGGIAHDFNNLLTSILGHTELIAADLGPGHDTAQDLDEVKKASERAAALVEQLLAFGRKQVVKPEVLDLNRVIREDAKMLRRILGEDVELVTELAEGAPMVSMDRSQVGQILLNLAVNARDAMPRGGRLCVRTSTEVVEDPPEGHDIDFVRGTYVILRVSDTGHGMDEPTMGRIFEPFFTTKEVGKGTGLGLSTVYGIVKQNGGFIGVESRVGGGTTFVTHLPHCREAARAPDEAPRIHVEPGQASGSATVLLVEDEPGVRKIVRRVLEREGFRVLEAGGGKEALELLDRHEGSIELLLTDLIMPRMTGRAVAEAVVSRHHGVRVLFMSGHTDDVLGERGVLTPETEFLPKPFDRETLVSHVRRVMEPEQWGPAPATPVRAGA